MPLEFTTFITSLHSIESQVAHAQSKEEIQGAGERLVQLLEANTAHLKESKELTGRVVEVLRAFNQQGPALQEVSQKIASLLGPTTAASSTNTTNLSPKQLLDQCKQSGDFFRAVADLPQTDRVDVAKLCAQENGWNTARDIMRFGIEDQGARIAIAKLCAQEHAVGTARYIKNFAIEDQEALIAIAKICVEKSARNVIGHIAKFEIENQEALVAIAKFCAQECAQQTAKHIKGFKIESQDARTEIAKLCAQRSGRATAASIKQFEIEGQDALIDIAKLCAKNTGKMADLINKFEITDQGVLIEIAELCAQKDGWATATSIQDFGITDEGARIAIARLCAHYSGWGTASNINGFRIENQDALIEIAKLCAQQSGKTASYIKSFRIQDQEVLIALAKLCAQQEGAATARFIQDFGIESQEDLIATAELCAKQDGSATAQYIKNFGIENQNARIAIAQLCAQQSWQTAAFIENFEIVSQGALVTLAMLCAEKNVRGTVGHIQKFGIESQDARTAIAELCAKRDGGATAESIQNFALTNQDARIAIAKLCAQNGAWAVAQYIKSFRVEDQEALIELAVLCAEKSGKTASHIQNFGIEDQSLLIEIAKLCAQQDGETTAASIQKFGIESLEARIAIAKLCAQQSGKTAAHIQNFGIQDQDILIEIAKLCAQEDTWQTTASIKNFGIESLEARIAIAKLCAQNDGAITAANIQNFGIEDQDILIEIAKLCAQRSGKTAAFVRNFGIEDQEVVISIAKLCAEQNGLETASNIKKFEITDRDVLLHLAKLCIQQNGESAAYIREFGFESQDTLIILAKLCAQKDGWATAKFIERFGIDDQGILIDIAKLCAQQNGAATAENIKNFGIQDQEVLIQLAKLCAQQNGATAAYIKNFGIQDQDTLIEIANLCARQNGQETAEHIGKFGIEELPVRQALFVACVKSHSGALDHVQAFALTDPLIHRLGPVFLQGRDYHENQVASIVDALSCELGHKERLQAQIAALFQIKDEDIRSEAMRWFAASLACLDAMDAEAQNWLLGSGLWSELAELRAPALREKLRGKLFDLASEPTLRGFWSAQLPSSPEHVKRIHLAILPLKELETPESSQEFLADVFHTLTQTDRGTWRHKPFITDVLTTLTQLTKQLSTAEKAHALKRMCFEENEEPCSPSLLAENFKAVRGLLQMGAQGWMEEEAPLSQLFRAKLEEVIPFGGYEGDPVAGYEKHFIESRHPDGLLQYASGIQGLHDPRATESLGRIIRSILEGSFRDKRYDTTLHPHLATVFRDRPALEQAWKELPEFPFAEQLEGAEVSQADQDWGEWLQDVLLTHGHLTGVDLHYVTDYLNTEAPQERAEVSRALGRNLGQYAAALRKSGVAGKDLRGDPKYQNLRLQSLCINLVHDQEKHPLAKLLELREWIPQDSEFQNDVEGMLKTLTARPAQNTELTVFVTDDPLDLLYSGTDVEGSCQRVDGTPSLNRGLLGTLEDGKIQMLAIKEKANKSKGKTLARRLLKLMWDGEQPVLYQELTYPKGGVPEYEQALTAAAKKRAAALGIPLMSNYGDKGPPKLLHSLGSRAPYEYSDGAKGLQNDGKYSHSARLV